MAPFKSPVSYTVACRASFSCVFGIAFRPVEAFPLVSVVMPYFDHEKYLLAAADSVADLDYPNLELIVIDDCSPKNHAEKILSGCSVANLRVIRREKNGGHIAAKNTGVNAAKGQYIMPLDSDDMVKPSYLKETIPLFKDESIGVVLTDVELIGDQDSVYTPALTKREFVNLMTPSNTFVARRRLFTELGPYDETLQYGDETDFLLRAIENGWKIGHVRSPLYLYRKHEKGLSLSVSYVKLLSDMIDRHPQTFSEHLKDALLYREQRYWGEVESVEQSRDGSDLASYSVTARQYQHLHNEFHKLLRQYEELQVELNVLQNKLECVMNGKLFRFREKVYRLFGSIKP